MQFDVAVDLSNIGTCCSRWAVRRRRCRAYERSRAIRQSLADSDPKDVLAQNRLAWTCSNLARAYGQLGRHDDAVGWARKLRFFGGLSVEEAAMFLDIASATVKRDWTFARAWLSRELAR